MVMLGPSQPPGPSTTFLIMVTHMLPLSGSALLQKVKELPHASKSDLVRACGFVTDKGDGEERLNFTAFYEALLLAKGVDLSGGDGRSGNRGKPLSYQATVHFNGNLLVGKAYVLDAGYQPGDEFEIKPTHYGFRLVATEPRKLREEEIHLPGDF